MNSDLKTLYVGYSSTNYELAQPLAVELGLLGYDVQFEQKLAGGEVGWQQVFESIQSCDLFVFALTWHSLYSYSCQVEYRYAHALGKRILPVLLADIGNYSIPVELSLIPLVDHRWEQEDYGPILEDALRHLPPPYPAPVPPPLRPELVVPLQQLQNEVMSLPPNEREQRLLARNLTDFLERFETFNDARDILRLLQTNPKTLPAIKGEIEATFDQIARFRSGRASSSRRRRALREIGLVVGGALLILIVVRGFLFLRSTFGASTGDVTTTATPTDQLLGVAAAFTGTPAPEMSEALVMGETAEATDVTTPLPLLPPSTKTPRSTSTSTSTSTLPALPTNTASSTPTATALPPTETRVPPSSTPTLLPPSATVDTQATQNVANIEMTLTQAFATLYAFSSATSVPPSATALPTRTSSPAPTNTPLPPVIITATPFPTLTPSPLPSRTPTYTPSLLPSRTPTRTPSPLPPTLPSLGASAYVGILVEDTPQGVQIRDLRNTVRTAGVQVGDYIITVDFQPIPSAEAFRANLNARRAFSVVNLRLLRGASEVFVRLMLNPVDFALATATPTG